MTLPRRSAVFFSPSLASIVLFVLAAFAGSASYAKTATTTTLQVSSACVAQGCVTTLTATVLAGATPVHPGLVYFCDGTAARCEYGLPVGEGETIANGSATIRRTLSPGVHHLHAVFEGTAQYSESVSPSQDLTITPLPNPVTTTGLISTGDAFGYYLIASVQGFGPVYPTGTVSYLDTSNGNAQVASATLAPEESYFGYAANELDLSQITSIPKYLTTGAAAGDFNGDGFQDVVTITTSGVQVLLGNGAGRFTLAPSTSNMVGTQAKQILVADFNGDGKLDIAVPDTSTNKLYVSLGNGDGTFHDATPTTLSATPVNFYIGDFNDDGLPDILVSLATVTNGTTTYSVQPLLGTGNGTFTEGTSLPGRLAIAVADFDLDGNLDFAGQEAGANLNQGTIVVLHGNGDGTFTPLTKSSPNYPGMTVSGDFNGDGIPDLAIYDGAILSYYQGKGDGSFAIPNGGANSLILDAQFSLLITGDFNGDGILDAAAVEEPIGTTNDYLFEVLLGDKSHSTGFQFDANDSNVLMPDQNPALVAADFTSDGIPDLLAFVAGGYVPAGTPPSTYVGGYSSISRSTSQPTSLQGTGIHTVIANYPGDSNHDRSASAPISLEGVQSVNYSNGFTSAAGLTLNGGATVTGGAIQLTDGGQFESRGAFTTSRVPVYYFNTTFDFQITNAEADGFAFVVQSNGPNAVGSGGGGIGYGQPPGATSGASIVNSFALVFDLHNNQGEGNNSIRTEVGGVTSGTGTTGATDLTPYGLDLHSGHRFRAALLGYASGGSILTLTDLDTSKSYTTQLGDDQFKALGDTVGYVGFTAGTGEQTESVRILDWSYVGQACCLSIPLTPQVPAYGEGFPAGASLMALNGGATIAGGALQLTNGTQFEATSAYFLPKVGTGHWTSDFDFSITGTEGDGFTYVLQDQGVAAVGSSGGGLGYGTDGPDVPGRTIGNSLAVKFDLHNNAGEGTNSTGIYFNGASPTVPAVDLSPSRINLHNGHTFHVRLYLDADFNLNMSVTDLTEYAVFNTKFSVEGQSILSNYAFAGFTAGTGMTSNTVKIQNWTWNYYDVDLTP